MAMSQVKGQSLLQSLLESLYTLYTKRDILAEHFQTDLALENNTVWLKSLPLIINNDAPTLDKIPLFIYRIFTKVSWGSEADSLESLAREYSLLYSCTTQRQWSTIVNQTMKTGSFKALKYLASEGFIAKFDIPFIMRDDA